MIATTPTLLHMLDFPPSKVLEDLLVPSVSLVLLTLGVLDLKPLSASSILAVDLEVAPSLPSVLVASLLSAAGRITSVFLAMLVSLTAPILLNTAAPSERRPALVTVWVEVLATMVFVSAIGVRVRTVLPLHK